MSIPATPPPESTPPRRHLGPLLMVLLILVGIVLLLPGLCSLVFIGLSVGSSSVGPLGALWLICFLISAGGVALIVYAIRNRPKSG